MITEQHRAALLEPYRLMLPCGHHNYRKRISKKTGKPRYICTNMGCQTESEHIIDKKTEAKYRAY